MTKCTGAVWLAGTAAVSAGLLSLFTPLAAQYFSVPPYRNLFALQLDGIGLSFIFVAAAILGMTFAVEFRPKSVMRFPLALGLAIAIYVSFDFAATILGVIGSAAVSRFLH